MLWGFLAIQKINNKMRKFNVLGKYKYLNVNIFVMNHNEKNLNTRKSVWNVIFQKYFFRMKHLFNHFSIEFRLH